MQGCSFTAQVSKASVGGPKNRRNRLKPANRNCVAFPSRLVHSECVETSRSTNRTIMKLIWYITFGLQHLGSTIVVALLLTTDTDSCPSKKKRQDHPLRRMTVLLPYSGAFTAIADLVHLLDRPSNFVKGLRLRYSLGHSMWLLECVLMSFLCSPIAPSSQHDSVFKRFIKRCHGGTKYARNRGPIIDMSNFAFGTTFLVGHMLHSGVVRIVRRCGHKWSPSLNRRKHPVPH